MDGLSQQRYDAPIGPIEFCDVGKGLPVLYFHGTGAGNDAAVLLEQELIAAGCRLIVPNRPGYSRTVSGSGSVNYCARLAVELLDHLQLDRVALIGTSGGGMPAAEFNALKLIAGIEGTGCPGGWARAYSCFAGEPSTHFCDRTIASTPGRCRVIQQSAYGP